MSLATLQTTQTVHVFDANLFWVTAGANQGDGLDLAAFCVPGDVYQLDRDARPLRLMFEVDGDSQRIAEGSDIGQSGQPIEVVSRHVLMAPEGDSVDMLLLRNSADDTLFVLPMSPIAARVDYTLLEAHEDPGSARLTDLICVAFTTGTMITIAGGAQRPIETLQPGDRILTRDNGPQPLRLITKSTMRAFGSFAPVVISSGTLGNEGDLVVSPHHRLFLYRRGPARIGHTAELLVQAKHLVDDEHVWRREGGYVDYYALIFDRHEIIYAEGIPIESLMVTEASLSQMPEQLTAEIRARMPDLAHKPHFGTEAGREMLERIGRDTLFSKRR
ncbi:Hint domain-containing protein [Thioclava sp. GXIMD4216]|uniref:Hint domain-containing protein n=1 Tax=Thioclava litoralis TaxID=3076557 RepID=A0ABZ1DWH4_9RHOB|nr:Hint domain-containing protein [Thioclava sp. FTW29]